MNKIVCLGGGSRYFTRVLGDLAINMDEAPVYLKGFLEKRIAWQEPVVDAGV